MKIGLKIKKLRIEKGMTQEELAEKTDLTARTIQRIENGEVEPRAYSLKMITSALNVDFHVFMETGSDEDGDENTAHTNNWLTLLHLSGIFHLVLPTIILWYRKKDTVRGITKHFKNIITFQFYCWLAFVIPGLFIYWKLGKPHFLFFGLFMTGILSINNAIKVFNNKSYQYNFKKLSKDKNKQDL